MANDKVFATIDGKEYSKKQFYVYIGKLTNRSRVDMLRKKGYSMEKIAEIADMSESLVRRICKRLDEGK